MAWKHSFAKVWLYRLGNNIYINNKNFLAENINNIKNKFEIKPLDTSIVIGKNLLEDKELSEVIEISYNDMQKNLGLTIYKMAAGDKRWNKGQQNIFYLGKKLLGRASVPDGTIRKMKSYGKCKILWDRLNKCVKVVGDDFGTPEGSYDTGTSTPWVYYEIRKEEKIRLGTFDRIEDFYSKEQIDEASERWFEIEQGKYEESIKRLRINEPPVMITEEGYLLCLPKPKKGEPLPKILIVGKTGKGKCQPKGSKVLMSDGTWKNIEDIKIGEEVISPQKDGTNIFSKVIDTNSWYSEKNYQVKQANRFKKPLYKCSSNHLIPVYHNVGGRNPHNKKSPKRPKELAYWKIQNYEAERLSKIKNKKNHNNIGFSSFPIEKFKDRTNCMIEPYTLGVFLGDGMYREDSHLTLNEK